MTWPEKKEAKHLSFMWFVYVNFQKYWLKEKHLSYSYYFENTEALGKIIHIIVTWPFDLANIYAVSFCPWRRN